MIGGEFLITDNSRQLIIKIMHHFLNHRI